MATAVEHLEKGQRVRVTAEGVPDFATVRLVAPPDDNGVATVVLIDDDGVLHELNVGPGTDATVRAVVSDGSGDSARVLAGMWTRWMAAAATNAESSAIATTQLRPYAHQTTAVYGAMLPQPLLRFLLADEPGTGKTIMAGLYLREMQRLGLVQRAIVVCPANLTSKWIADFDRFFGGGLRPLTANTVREDAVGTHKLWVVSLELAAVNPVVQDAIRPDLASWDLVIFDEAHRLTPTATSFHRVGRLLAENTPRALLMTATPHRGKEWLFRHLLHLVDPEVYPDPGENQDVSLPALRPGPIHFLRRMKEDLVDYDGKTRLFKDRTAENIAVPLSSFEFGFYKVALEMVDRFFPPTAQPLARMVYGKRAASTLEALKRTLLRRFEHMGEKSEAEAVLEADREFSGDETEVDEARVIHVGSTATRAERAELKTLIGQLDEIDSQWRPSKWKRLIDDALAANGIVPGNSEQAVVFSEYADSAEWIADRLNAEGFTARVYSGRQTHRERDEVRLAFMRGEFQIIVTTDAGNEGIDLQAAHVLVNYDIPWSLVRLEQRMGRIHRVGQERDVFLYNLIASDTREGQTLLTLLNNFVVAANKLRGQMFDSLSAVAEITGVEYDKWLTDLYGNDESRKAAATHAAAQVQARDLERVARQVKETERLLASQVDAVAALTLLQRDLFARINPAIVEAYLDRLDGAGIVTVQKTAAGEGFRQVSRDAGLPDSLGGGPNVLVATSGEAIRNATTIDLADPITLGPGEPAFTDLIEIADSELEEDVFRSGAVDDPTSLTAYDLYAFEAEMIESSGKRNSVWATLVKVDDGGSARAVRWETLANLVPTSRAKGTHSHPARLQAAQDASAQVARSTLDEHRRVRDAWFGQARKDLNDLPLKITESIEDRDERIELRKQLQQQTAGRLEQLKRLAQVELTTPRLIGRLRVLPAATQELAEEVKSEWIAMKHVQQLLEEDDWHVDDVHTEGRGYDLEARRHSQVRQVEVKGVAGDASSTGIRMTGNEVLIATQHRTSYWLYVVDQCADGSGRLFGAYEDPATLFSSDMIGDAIFRVPGSSLKNAPGSTAR
jgi:superfamily II DNA or RNA helicase